MDKPIELIYRKNRGRSQLIVLILYMAEVNFEWTSQYIQSDLIRQGLLPFNQVPLLIDREQNIIIAQSCAIVRYLAQKYDLYPSRNCLKEIAINEQMMEQHVDM